MFMGLGIHKGNSDVIRKISKEGRKQIIVSILIAVASFLAGKMIPYP